ncbi:translation factor SUA5 [Cognatiyoonia koreensis]|uniref:Threonylcarbamoyl-AMP synthase n=1 Tax=Cognatiyoonia koreensis TaxID=364200 RepID=A0A1I0RDQ6_9RHOB|nr:L-threonylcarbamoyladenylate synthase [Cognatiyoonia koreensis]SEW39007.1 translation factor SUA5 [Cognatiyoonia koreensis]
MKQIDTERLFPDEAGLARAGAILRAGGLAAFPTETVYGLGANALDDKAVARIYEAKGRPRFNPLIVHVADRAAAEELVVFDDAASRLADAFWPGALTLVLPLRAGSGISSLVTAGLDTLAVRAPDHPVGQAVLRASGVPVAAPSANPSGRVSPTTADHVIQGLDGLIDAVLDGGPCGVGVESTIVVTGPNPTLLRAGGIPVEALSACLGQAISIATDPTRPISPGQLESHYAPNGTLRLNAQAKEDDEVLLGFGPVDADLNLSVSGDLVEAASRLFSCLHALDDMGATQIAVSPIPDSGLGRAINDRLKRAAAPRSGSLHES